MPTLKPSLVYPLDDSSRFVYSLITEEGQVVVSAQSYPSPVEARKAMHEAAAKRGLSIANHSNIQRIASS